MIKFASLISLLSVFIFPLNTFSAMSSVNYNIFADNLETGGGLQQSASFNLEGTTGESPVDIINGSTYEIKAGYQFMERGSLGISINPTSINLGELTSNAISTDISTIEVSTDSETGYSLSITAVSGSSLTMVSDGEVTAGSEEYGLSATGSDSLLSGDVAIVNGLLISSATTPTYNNETALSFKASMSASSPAGSYSQNLTLTASTNF
jgi:hypothetical protein